MKTEFDKFDAVIKKVLSVSHDELQKREKEGCTMPALERLAS
jgi:hypothetical protein